MSILNRQKILLEISDLTLNNGKLLKDRISDIVIKPQGSQYNIAFSIDVSDVGREEGERVKILAIEKLQRLPDIAKVTIILTSEINTDGADMNDKIAGNLKQKYYIDGVKKVILVSAGKGGVGKSTITALIAENLNMLGYKVGIVDADIYGPSQPQIFNLNSTPQIVNKKMIPLISRGIQIISIGFLIKNSVALPWRGPMVTKAIYQLLSLTDWQNLDYLIVDMPPGTGDIHLSILENYHVYGVVMVTTPQLIARIDVEKSINLYKKFNIPILAMIENMSYFIDLNGKRTEIFSGSSGKYLAEKYDIKFLQQIPLLPELASNCDLGNSLNHIAPLLQMDWLVSDREKR